MSSSHNTENLNIISQTVLITPEQLKSKLPASETSIETVNASRQTIENILDKKDHRMFLVIGPCSIHDTKAALDYAARLKKLADEVSDTLFLVMRVYFEKPRTTVGWKGLINDPHIDGTFKIEEGLHIGRQLLLDITNMGLSTSTEALDPISPQYLQDLISWSAIGARTTESQTHREMASGLSSAVGFKNGTDGNLEVAMNALQSVAHSHSFLGINNQGQVAIIETKGNPYAHVVLRGGNKGPNFDRENIAICEEKLATANINANIMIDASHANSNKDHNKQVTVIEDATQQVLEGNKSIIGLMIESNIGAGNQKVSEEMQYGVSITDACIDWETTETAIRNMRDALKDVLPSRA